MGNYIVAFMTLLCAAIITGIGLYAQNSETPVSMWEREKPKPEDLVDVHAYNHANAIMWIVYSLLFWVSGIVALFDSTIASYLMIASVIIGFPIVYAIYKSLRKKYTRKS